MIVLQYMLPGEIAETPHILVTPQTTASGKQSEEPQENKEQDTPSNAEDGMEKSKTASFYFLSQSSVFQCYADHFFFGGGMYSRY